MFWTIAYDDVSDACDVLAPVFDATNGVDGMSHSKCLPRSPSTAPAAREIHQAVAKSNLMVKIPATEPCVESIEAMIAEGRNINVTLIFSLDRYDKVIDAHIKGLESLAAAGTTDLSKVASVASFFISRVDSEVDKRLDAIATPEALSLRGKAAVAQGVLAYQLFRRRFSGPRWARLVALGARVQRPLWASTSTKNPAYPVTLYVDSLIGPDTVNTLAGGDARSLRRSRVPDTNDRYSRRSRGRRRNMEEPRFSGRGHGRHSAAHRERGRGVVPEELRRTHRDAHHERRHPEVEAFVMVGAGEQRAQLRNSVLTLP